MAVRKAIRAKRRRAALPGVDWTITSSLERSPVDGYPLRIVHICIERQRHKPVQFSLSAEEAFDLREDIGRAYDEVN